MIANKIGLFGLLGLLLLGGCGKDDTDPGLLPGLQDKAPAVVAPESYFIANEDIFGRQNGTVNRIRFDGRITYRAYRKANPGAQLGVTTQFAAIYGGNIYFVSKQGVRFVVADAATLARKASFTEIGGDGRACVGVDARTMYVSTNAGIRIFDIPSLGFTGSVDGIDAGGADLYTGQIGDMVCIGSRVFAAMQGRGILVIDTRTHAVEAVIEPQSSGGVCMSRNGWIWVSGNPLKAYDPYTLEVRKTVALSAAESGGGVDWGTWRTGSLCAGTQHNTIYWLESRPQSMNAKSVRKYDITQGRLTQVMELDTYGAIRIDPLTDYITTVDGTMYDDTGAERQKFTILGGMPATDGSVDESLPNPYWFSALPVFEDVNRPTILPSQIVLLRGKVVEISLSDMVVDHDNCSQSILKEAVFDAGSLVEYDIRQDLLRLKGLRIGETSFLLKVSSNGLPAEKRISIKVV